MELVTGLGALLVAGAVFAYKKWGHSYVKDALKVAFDNPNTATDESEKFDALASELIKAAAKLAVERALAEAMKNPKVDAANDAATKLFLQFPGQLSLVDAKKLVSDALKEKK